MSARRVAVTGGTGHLGPNLVRALLGRGDSVRVLVRGDGDDGTLDGLDVERCAGDVADPASMDRCFAGAELVFHLAACISITGDQGGRVTRTNVDGARNAAEAARGAGVRRFVHVASVHAFDLSRLDAPIDEASPRATGPRHAAYDRSKALGEAAVREVYARGLDGVIVHPSGVLGPADARPSRMGQLLLNVYHRRLIAVTPGGFDWVDVRDVVAGTLAAAEQGRAGESYILSGHWQAITELAAMVSRLTGVPAPAWTAPMWLARGAAPLLTTFARVTQTEPLYTSEALDALESNRQLLHHKAARELGYEARPTEDTVRDLFRWFEANGRLAR